MGLAWDDVQRLPASTGGKRPADRRDRTALLLLAVYGLRAGEVSGLRLDDVDWEAQTLRVRRPKPGRTHLYPLSRLVGEALLRYLQESRPRRAERAIRPKKFAAARSHIQHATSAAVGVITRRTACLVELTAVDVQWCQLGYAADLVRRQLISAPCAPAAVK